MGRELIYIFFSLVQALTITIEGSLFRPKKERKKIYLPQVLPRVNPTLKSHVETKLTYVPALVKMDESALSLSLSRCGTPYPPLFGHRVFNEYTWTPSFGDKFHHEVFMQLES